MFCVQNNLVGPRVRLARKKHSPALTQSELAALLQVHGWDISRSGVAKIELGIRGVSDLEAERLADALGVPISWLFEQNNESESG